MKEYIDLDEIKAIVDTALETCKDDLHPQFYRGARHVLDLIYKLSEYQTERNE